MKIKTREALREMSRTGVPSVEEKPENGTQYALKTVENAEKAVSRKLRKDIRNAKKNAEKTKKRAKEAEKAVKEGTAFLKKAAEAAAKAVKALLEKAAEGLEALAGTVGLPVTVILLVVVLLLSVLLALGFLRGEDSGISVSEMKAWMKEEYFVRVYGSCDRDYDETVIHGEPSDGNAVLNAYFAREILENGNFDFQFKDSDKEPLMALYLTENPFAVRTETQYARDEIPTENGDGTVSYEIIDKKTVTLHVYIRTEETGAFLEKIGFDRDEQELFYALEESG